MILNYIEKGCGRPLILLHGNGNSSRYFKKQIRYFSAKFRVIAVDTRGHGKSPRGGGPFTMERFADDLKIFMEEMGIEKADILGFSDGANIALIFALRWPERVGRLVLCGANLSPDGLRFLPRLSFKLRYRLAKDICKDPKKTELADLAANQPRIDEKWLSRLRMPVLVLAGTFDIVKKKHTQMIAGAIFDSQLQIMFGAHSLPSLRPGGFNRIVDKFLSI